MHAPVAVRLSNLIDNSHRLQELLSSQLELAKKKIAQLATAAESPAVSKQVTRAVQTDNTSEVSAQLVISGLQGVF